MFSTLSFESIAFFEMNLTILFVLSTATGINFKNFGYLFSFSVERTTKKGCCSGLYTKTGGEIYPAPVFLYLNRHSFHTVLQFK